jgi:hypothetical protein
LGLFAFGLIVSDPTDSLDKSQTFGLESDRAGPNIGIEAILSRVFQNAATRRHQRPPQEQKPPLRARSAVQLAEPATR